MTTTALITIAYSAPRMSARDWILRRQGTTSVFLSNGGARRAALVVTHRSVDLHDFII
jgi:hypothetical protein